MRRDRSGQEGLVQRKLTPPPDRQLVAPPERRANKFAEGGQIRSFEDGTQMQSPPAVAKRVPNDAQRRRSGLILNG